MACEHLSLATMAALLDKLCGDDGFRERLLAEPAAALASLRIHFDPAQIPAERRLPSEAALAASRAALAGKLDGQAALIPVFVNWVWPASVPEAAGGIRLAA